ncbi:beta-defensin 125 [Perognathus longimembris pacificus]|uniref:beta-defensin 125 n=1 Tax=Perognathus longimembris pacificus TaxID=214514 RepID=UPI0020193AFF|nr:beta-defensin 125 [Perognathus longimembris pacificus]
MTVPMLAFIICGLLTQIAKASWGELKCWKNDLGRCRRRCLDNERYIRLCKNKVSCCIPWRLSYEFTPRPPPPFIQPEVVTIDFSEWTPFPVSPNLRDTFTFNENEPGVTFSVTKEQHIPTTVEHTPPAYVFGTV